MTKPHSSGSAFGLSDFKRQLNTLSDCLQYFDPEQRSEAISILQECIQDLESNNAHSPSPELLEQLDCGDNETIPDAQQFESSTNLLLNDPCPELNSPNDDVECNSKSDEEVDSQSEEDSSSSLKCPKCEDEYDNKNSFLEHLQSHPGKVKSCNTCLKEFSNSISFKFHKQLEMCLKSSKVLKCNLCNKKLCGESQYNIHVNAHKRNQCKQCGDHFSRRKHLIAHELNAHNISQNKDLFRCDICDRTFTQKRSLVHHFKIVHSDSNEICPVCLEVFDAGSELGAHITSHNQQSFVCDKCGEKFTRRQQYLIHIQVHDKYKCSTCNSCFSSKKHALSHARKGHSVSGLDNQLQCSECKKVFCSKSVLRKHMLEHTGNNALTCEKCKVTFKCYRNFLRHLESKEHLQGEESNILLACKECNKTFTSHNSLRVHSTLLHKAVLVEHTCTYCSYKTKFPKNMKRHIALHTEKPQFICDVCGSQFQMKNALQEHHLRIHAVRKNFSCEKCGKAFGRSSDLNRHLTNTHADAPLYACHCGNKYKSLSNLKRHQLTSHEKVDMKQRRLKKLYPLNVAKLTKRKLTKSITNQPSLTGSIEAQKCDTKPPKKKFKKTKSNQALSTKVVEEIPQLIDPQVPLVSVLPETNTIVMENNLDQDLLGVTYNMDFAEVDKSQVVYSHDLDLSSFQVESVIQLENEPIIEGAGVLINVRNLFTQPLTNEFIIPAPLESSMIVELEESLNNAAQHLDVKEDIISSLQEYILPQELNFF